jgi:ABC-2 type transport system permease protein
MLLATWSLWRREVVRFLRQRSRIVGALGSPVLFWLLIGSGFGRSVRADQALPGGYLEYFYPGTLALIVLFTAIFSTISVIEDRQQGFLQGVLAAPVPRLAIVGGKVLGATTLALFQAGLFLLLAPLTFGPLRPGALLTVLAVLILLGLGLSGLGFLLAWQLDSIQGFHAIMNVLLVPMWMLSGALFPASGAAGWIRAVMWANPLTYGVSALRTAIYGGATAGEPPLALSAGVLAAFVLLTLALGARAVTSEGRGTRVRP